MAGPRVQLFIGAFALLYVLQSGSMAQALAGNGEICAVNEECKKGFVCDRRPGRRTGSCRECRNDGDCSNGQQCLRNIGNRARDPTYCRDVGPTPIINPVPGPLNVPGVNAKNSEGCNNSGECKQESDGGLYCQFRIGSVVGTCRTCRRDDDCPGKESCLTPCASGDSCRVLPGVGSFCLDIGV